MTKREFLEEFDEIVSRNDNNMFVEILNPEMTKTECIEFSYPDFKYKRKYYDKNYNENMELISYDKIKIVGIM